MTTTPRLFHLQRDHDVSGVSGTGRVADGVLWSDGTVAVRWLGDRPSTVHWDRLDDALAIHGHGGATRIVWADEQPSAARAAILREAAEQQRAFLRHQGYDLDCVCDSCSACLATEYIDLIDPEVKL
ncbi:hypothetical protein ACH4ND_01395 [Streptomyces sp. NPDC017179]|uniref:hypothetical protein n=1 Tax=Streptomyces sp. NPDC017179 TaxID=3364979 RepID=UPI0037A74CEE